ncbi:MAG: hypothetical protein CVU11_10305 [Bacteroidetes bacterium HGW-Bacteroidetes-6]|jgi:phosphate:Na+ symporter|nr:MAG: hypothetical protein CVU11_10305 [Bacteroidetes bacterium HGW-Bacteroidetes-6]
MMLFLQILGALSIFLFGMKLMSEALQKLAGSRLRQIMHSITRKNRRSFLSGLGITALLQSSSATTVLAVGMVHAGLISLRASLPIVLGANIGTTVKFWFISLLGFSVDITMLILPLAALCLPLFFLKKRVFRDVQHFAFGFILLFTGLYFIKSSAPELTQSEFIRDFIEQISGYGFGSVLLFVLLGFTITGLLQSSSATMTLTVVLAFEGLIDIPSAAAMILGENIGTTITANLAALMTNLNGKKVALFHLAFNIAGVSVALVFFNPFLRGVEWLSNHWFDSDSLLAVIPLTLTLFHTVFNLFFAILVLPFTGTIYRVFMQVSGNKKNGAKLKTTDNSLLSTAEMNLLYASERSTQIHEKMGELLLLSRELMTEKKDEKYSKLVAHCEKTMTKSRKWQLQLFETTSGIMADDISFEGNKQLQKLHLNLRLYSDLTTVLNKLISIIKLKNESRVWFNQQMRDAYEQIHEICVKSLDLCVCNANELSVATFMEARFRTGESIVKLVDAIEGDAEVPVQAKLYFSQIRMLLELFIDITLSDKENSENN